MPPGQCHGAACGGELPGVAVDLALEWPEEVDKVAVLDELGVREDGDRAALALGEEAPRVCRPQLRRLARLFGVPSMSTRRNSVRSVSRGPHTYHQKPHELHDTNPRAQCSAGTEPASVGHDASAIRVEITTNAKNARVPELVCVLRLARLKVVELGRVAVLGHGHRTPPPRPQTLGLVAPHVVVTVHNAKVRRKRATQRGNAKVTSRLQRTGERRPAEIFTGWCGAPPGSTRAAGWHR